MRTSLSKVSQGCRCGLFVIALALATMSSARADEDPQMGVWRLDTMKSRFTGEGPRSVIEHFSRAGDEVSYRRDMVDEQGRQVVITYSARFDGKEYPMLGNANADSVIIRRIDQHTMGLTYKKAGRVMSEHIRVISADGRTATLTAQRRDSHGEMLNHTVVLEKVEP